MSSGNPFGTFPGFRSIGLWIIRRSMAGERDQPHRNNSWITEHPRKRPSRFAQRPVNQINPIGTKLGFRIITGIRKSSLGPATTVHGRLAWFTAVGVQSQ
jgi:hypothetical protein